MAIPRRYIPLAGVPFLTGCLSGCNAAPTQSILGSFFPSWILCVVAGIGVSAALRPLLSTTGIARAVPAPLFVHLALAAAATFAVWLLWQD